MFEKRNIIYRFNLCISDQIDEFPYGLRRIPSSAQAAQCRHPGIIPTAYLTVADKVKELSLAHYSICEVQPVEFNLPGSVVRGLQLIDEPVVQWPVNLKFEGAERVCDTFKIITLAMGKIIHRVYIPFIACTVMLSFNYPVNYGITHMHIGGSHVYTGPQYTTSLFKFTLIHPVKQIQILGDRPFPERTLSSRLGRRSFLGGYHIC